MLADKYKLTYMYILLSVTMMKDTGYYVKMRPKTP